MAVARAVRLVLEHVPGLTAVNVALVVVQGLLPLDALAEAEIFDRFRELVRGRTAVLVSHRFSTVLLADRIYVFDRGEVVERGTHGELMAKGGLYARMFLAQAGPYR